MGALVPPIPSVADGYLSRARGGASGSRGAEVTPVNCVRRRNPVGENENERKISCAILVIDKMNSRFSFVKVKNYEVCIWDDVEETDDFNSERVSPYLRRS